MVPVSPIPSRHFTPGLQQPEGILYWLVFYHKILAPSSLPPYGVVCSYTYLPKIPTKIPTNVTAKPLDGKLASDTATTARTEP
jgi:hypothetical protein